MKFPGKHVVIIDDDEVVRNLLARLLVVAGCKVEASSSIKEGLKTIQATRPDLIILDLNMPEHDGLSLLAFRRQNEVLKKIPVLVLSGTKDQKEIDRSLEMGADQFLEKPFETRVVLQKLRYIFQDEKEASYRFSPEHLPPITIEIAASVPQFALGKLKLDSQVKLAIGKPIILEVEDYSKQSGKPLTCTLEKEPELSNGMFRADLSITGLDTKTKEQIEKWQRTLQR